MITDETKKLKKEVLDLRKSLTQLSNVVLLSLNAIDNECSPDKSTPHEISKRLAKIANSLEMSNDNIRYSILGVDFRKDDKSKVIKKLKTCKP